MQETFKALPVRCIDKGAGRVGKFCYYHCTVDTTVNSTPRTSNTNVTQSTSCNWLITGQFKVRWKSRAVAHVYWERLIVVVTRRILWRDCWRQSTFQPNWEEPSARSLGAVQLHGRSSLRSTEPLWYHGLGYHEHVATNDHTSSSSGTTPEPLDQVGGHEAKRASSGTQVALSELFHLHTYRR